MLEPYAAGRCFFVTHIAVAIFAVQLIFFRVAGRKRFHRTVMPRVRVVAKAIGIVYANHNKIIAFLFQTIIFVASSSPGGIFLEFTEAFNNGDNKHIETSDK